MTTKRFAAFFTLLFLLLVLAGCSNPLTGAPPSGTASDSGSRFPDNPNEGVTFDTENLEDIWLAGGCFWGVEMTFRNVDGVQDAIVGYTGGHTDNPTYREVCSDTTGHAEAVDALREVVETPA